MKRIGIIGLGRVGTSLALFLHKLGYTVKVFSRQGRKDRPESIKHLQVEFVSLENLALDAEVIIIATPDSVIRETVDTLAALPESARAVLHMSGALSSEVLSPLKNRGLLTASLHPLQSFASVEQAIKNLPGSYFTFEGDPELQRWAGEIVEKMGGILKVLPSPGEKYIYHAGACIVSNYLVALAHLGIECLKEAGFTAEEGREALLPLMMGTMNNIRGLSPGQALTGPISRGDTPVVRDHLAGLKERLPHIEKPYRALGSVLTELAYNSRRLTREQYLELRKTLGGGVLDV